MADPGKSPESEPSPEGGGISASFISHLIELRDRLLRAVISVGVVLVVLLPFANDIYEFLAAPLLRAMPQGTGMIATGIVSPFFAPLRLTLAAAATLAVPLILYQVWAFIAPALYKNERRLILPLIVSSTLLFYVGMAFAYLLVFPTVLQFFVSTAPKGVMVMPDIREYLDFAFTMFFAFGAAFEVPVVVVVLTRLGVVRPETLADKRSYVVIGIFVIAAILTPPDVLSQLFLAIPMWFLFEIGLLVSRYVAPRQEAESDGDTG